MLTIAIDPGATGGIAVRYADGMTEETYVYKMPGTPKDIYDELWNISRNSGYAADQIPPGCRAIVEKVGMHRQGNNASASCKFARHCGHIEMALLALGIPFEEVAPQVWMKSLGTLPINKTARKNAIKDKMQRKYPSIKITLWNADALGILSWATQGAKA